MFPLKGGYQVLCKPCHKAKTEKENSGRNRKRK
jgi:5-methylcytosine-specific restriction endonuclease McrA